MRSAQARMQVLENGGKLRNSVKRGLAVASGSGRGLRYAGMAGAGAVSALLCLSFAKKLRRPAAKRLAAPPAPVPRQKDGLLRVLILQGATAVVYPFLRAALLRYVTSPAGQAQAAVPAAPQQDTPLYAKIARFILRVLAAGK